MKKLGLLLVACFAFATISVAQNNIVKSLERNVPGQGKVTIHQDARIAALIGSEYVPAGSDEQKVIKSSGYRIQVYAGNNTRQAKNEAYAVATRIKEHFPELTVYTSFNPPRWLCRAGDFRSIEEADARRVSLAGQKDRVLLGNALDGQGTKAVFVHSDAGAPQCDHIHREPPVFSKNTLCAHYRANCPTTQEKPSPSTRGSAQR